MNTPPFPSDDRNNLGIPKKADATENVLLSEKRVGPVLNPKAVVAVLVVLVVGLILIAMKVFNEEVKPFLGFLPQQPLHFTDFTPTVSSQATPVSLKTQVTSGTGELNLIGTTYQNAFIPPPGWARIGFRFLDDSHLETLMDGKPDGNRDTYTIENGIIVVDVKCNIWYLKVEGNQLVGSGWTFERIDK